MKGYLKTAEGIFQLAPKVTTIGRDGCDLGIQSPGIDHQHAVIEFSEQENCFVLQDLNTTQGTYVNECRVQNATVRLAPGDVIQFGFSSAPYQLDVENHQQVTYPPVQQRPAWTQPLTVITDPVPPQVVYTQDGLPHLKQVISQTTATWQNSPGMQVPAAPKPPTSLRGRPLSAGSRRPTDPRTHGADGISAQRPMSGWVAGQGNPARVIHTTQQGTDMMAVQEKEQRMMRLNEEIRRLSIFESECSRKEVMIQQLREEIGDLQNKLRQMETSQSSSLLSSDAALTEKLIQLENDVSLKRTEIHSLKEQINQMRSNDNRMSPINRQEFNDRIMEINSLKTELERTKKDKNITSGLVSQMQRDMSNKDTTIARLTREIENLKKETHEKEVQITSLQLKFRRTQETKKNDEEIEAKEKELAQLRLKFRQTEKRVEEQTEVIDSLKEELDKNQRSTHNARESQKRLQGDLDSTSAKCQDFERTERAVRVDLEQASKRMERFRNRVVQVTFSTPGIRAPDKEINDDELMETLKKVVDERTDLMRKLQDANENTNVANSTKKDIIENSKKIKQQLNEAVERLCGCGFLASNVKKELDLVQTTSLDESLVWMRDTVAEMLQAQFAWETDIETALQQAGINVRISDETPAHHIAELSRRVTESTTVADELRVRIAQSEENHKVELETALEGLNQEITSQSTCDIEAVKMECEEKMNRIIEEIRETETEKREATVESERAKVAELEMNIEQLKASMLSQEAEFAQNKDDTRDAIEAVENYQKIEMELRGEVEKLTASHADATEYITRELEERLRVSSNEASTYKEQVRQHSVTICAMEERLNKVMKKSKDYQTEMVTLKSTITDLKKKMASRPSPPPKPKVIVQKLAIDVVAMEQTMIALQKEIAEYKRQITEQQDVIGGLRRDLSGASARLSDMTGEMSEAQKEAIENSRLTVRKQEGELSELRQQMAKLSTIVDKQSEEIRDMSDELNKKNSAVNKFKNVANEHEAKMRDMETHLTVEKEKSQKSLCLIEEEGRITSELSAIGAQCRGDRHDQVIARQREALTELRARIKALEQSKPPLPTSADQALQQVVLLKRELSELRASQAMADSQSGDMTQIDAHINRTRGLDPQTRADGDVERSAHRETLESLETSENTYLTLLRGVASALEMEEIGGLRSMAHIPRDERMRLAHEREAAVELLTSRIKVLQERIFRKDDLLAGYERDLAKLRQAEKLAETKHTQVESLATDIRTKTEESQYLRETLQRTKDRLEQEKRLNGAIKHKKTFHLENENVARGGWPRHQCPPEDIFGEKAKKKKDKNEKIKRKNYEIKTLKSELTGRESDLQAARRRMTTMEATLGLDAGRDPFEPPSVETH